MLFAQAEISTFERLLNNYGLATVLVFLFGAVCWKVLPKFGEKLADWINRLVEAGITHVNKVSDGVECLSVNMKENTEVMRDMRQSLSASQDPKGDPKFKDHIFSTVGTNKSLLAFSRAAREACEHLPADKQRRITPHLDEIEKLLG